MATIASSLFIITALVTSQVPSSQRADRAIAQVKKTLTAELKTMELQWGSPIFIRIFKETKELEVWVQKNKEFKLFKTYEICTYSGDLGPKLQEGDKQSPEGFYFVSPGRLNPVSNFHLSFNLGYPNKYERAHGRTGNYLMVHGNCVSIGCYAMTDNTIEKIYALAHAALTHGQPYFRVHAFPFRMTPERMDKAKSSRWYSFWLNLQEGYNAFENDKNPPNVEVKAKRYVFN